MGQIFKFFFFFGFGSIGETARAIIAPVIYFDDIDVNQHVNNCNYIIWAFEPLDFTFRSQKRLKTLDIVYKKEIQYGNKILSLIEIQGNTTIHNLKNAQTGEDLCQIKAEWK